MELLHILAWKIQLETYPRHPCRILHTQIFFMNQTPSSPALLVPLSLQSGPGPPRVQQSPLARGRLGPLWILESPRIKNRLLLCYPGRGHVTRGQGFRCPRLWTFGMELRTLRPEDYHVGKFYSSSAHLLPPRSRISFRPPHPCDSLWLHSEQESKKMFHYWLSSLLCSPD